MRRVTWFQRIRVHEAGHAVADYLLGRPPGRIRIHQRYRGSNRLQGFVRKKARIPRGTPMSIVQGRGRVPRFMRKSIMAAFAGGIAEIWFFDAARYEGLDWVRVIDLLNSYIGHKSVASDIFHRLCLETGDWFAKGRYMKAVSAVANALRAKPNMQGREVRRIIRSTGLRPLKEWQ